MEEKEAISLTIQQLCKIAENDNKKKNDLHNALGEIEIKGVKYQLQICLVANTNLWIPENSVVHCETRLY